MQQVRRIFGYTIVRMSPRVYYVYNRSTASIIYTDVAQGKVARELRSLRDAQDWSARKDARDRAGMNPLGS